MITPSFGLTATERVLPKLALDFTTASLDSRVTFTRTTGASNPATYVNSSGVVTTATDNEPRFDYDPVTLACKGLLIEESRSNVATYSEQFDNAAWLKTRATISADAVAAPDGNTTADKLVETATTGAHSIQSATTTIASATYTGSCYIKAGERTWALISIGVSTAGLAYFNLSTGAVGTTTGGYTASTVNMGNGWWRCIITGTIAVTSDRAMAVYTATGNGTFSYAGDGTSGIYVWGAQLEAGAFATSYIPTTSAALTRNADVATMTGTNFSDWFNASEGSFNAAVIPRAVDLTNGNTILSVNDNTNFNRYYAYVAAVTSVPNLQIRAASTVYMQSTSGTASANTLLSTCFAYKANNSAFSASGISANVDTSVTLPTVTQFQIGAHTTAVYLNGWVQKINYWPQRLTNNEVQAFSKG